MNDWVGRGLVGRYQLVDLVGSGGMGSVWRVWDAQRHQYVAAKLLRPADAGSLLRFVREQSLRVVHPHVLAPHGWAAEDDQVLLTMDLVRGGSVAQLLDDRGALPLPYVAVLIDQLLEALAAVHAQGIVHRDVKPSNLLLEPTGRGGPFLRLADFGVAAVLGEPRLTHTHLAIGTPGYMAPEHALGAGPDVRQDIYATGVVAVRLLTGRLPAAGMPDTLPDAIRAVIRVLSAESASDRPDSAAAARRDWRAALELAGVGPVDPDGPGAIEVFERLDPLPAGFGPDGPVASPGTAGFGATTPVEWPGTDPRAAPGPVGTFESGAHSGPGKAKRLGRPALVALGVAALAAAIVVPVVLTTKNSATLSGSVGPAIPAGPAESTGSPVPTSVGASLPGTTIGAPPTATPRSSADAPGTVSQPGRTTAGQTTPVASSPRAPVDDSFSVSTTDGCGSVDFVDRGGNNDNALVHDYCADGHGVKAYAWLDGTYLGAAYNGNGEVAAPVTWSPFGSVRGGQHIGLKVCLVDGTDDPTPSRCAERTVTSVDG
ncbi:protein kinase [Amycolatopsis cynarae]|uniref:Protein kinase n=1 Tax=Amycolatopsis cynarae TaxID=2995223 RepID=A0ABY7B2B7_9PSEU|nr:serine/threonine protein kinase [Amycolatopsis sp. HUAS 11-8]WAL64958.1 protein kinase [Amycolatopsis sp. HUAS 11-8]